MSFPRPINTIFDMLKKSEPLGRETDRLMREGYVNCRKIDYLYLAHRCWGSFESHIWVKFITHKREMRRIVEILTDERTGTATVIYEVGLAETPFVEWLREIDPVRLEYLYSDIERQYGTRDIQSVRQQHSVKLKKWDQGWRVK